MSLLERLPRARFAAVAAALGAGLVGILSAQAPPEVRITVLSSQPTMVTGGDALVRVDVSRGADAGNLRVTLNSADVTSAFRRDGVGSSLVGRVTGLVKGENTLTTSAGGARAGITLVNYPITGPVFSGPHERPFVCETENFKLRSGGTLGPALDENCSAKTRVDYVYRSKAGNALQPLTDLKALPADVAHTTTLNGTAVPYIVRIETGTINRAIYQTAVLHNPIAEPSPDFMTRPTGWNGRLIYTFGGGCIGGWYKQGNSTGNVEDDVMLRQGYAVASASLNVFGNNCNDLLSSETMMMVKERFVEAYGAPLFTIGWGSSGGSYQSHQTADNYPGLLDGIVVGSSFPDVGHGTISVHSFGARLMYHYFENATEKWTPDEQLAASGLPNYDSLKVQGTRPDRIRPFDGCEDVIPPALRYDPVNNRRGARCTVYDHTINVYGRDPATGFARRFLDNVGVQYGLAALNAGKINKPQFLDLNERIGGVDIDANFTPQRTVGDRKALRVAYESGRILNAGGGLASTAIIDYRGYADFDEGDPHMRFYSFSTRQRLVKANGHANNHVMWIEDGSKYGLFSTRSPVLQEALRQMDRWLVNIGPTTSSEARAKRVVQAKPAELADACWSPAGEKIVETQTYDGPGKCNALYPSHASPYLVAGMPLANNVVKCQLKPIQQSDYKVSFSREELERLQKTFPEGVCDYTKTGVEQRPLKGTWLSFGPSMNNVILGTN